jgi:hypothetical protein
MDILRKKKSNGYITKKNLMSRKPKFFLLSKNIKPKILIFQQG